MSKPAKNPQLLPAPEAESLPKRRAFTAEYKARILAECDTVTESGQIGEILRREGLYSSHLVDWRRQRAAGGLQGLTPKKTGRPPKNPTLQAAAKELERLRRENARLEEKLRRSQIIIDAQKNWRKYWIRFGRRRTGATHEPGARHRAGSGGSAGV